MAYPRVDPTDTTRFRAVRLPGRLDDAIRARAVTDNVTMSDVIRDALTAHLTPDPPDPVPPPPVDWPQTL